MPARSGRMSTFREEWIRVPGFQRSAGVISPGGRRGRHIKTETDHAAGTRIADRSSDTADTCRYRSEMEQSIPHLLLRVRYEGHERGLILPPPLRRVQHPDVDARERSALIWAAGCTVVVAKSRRDQRPLGSMARRSLTLRHVSHLLRSRPQANPGKHP